MILIIGLLAGFALGYLLPYEITVGNTIYTAIIILICIDSILGGTKAYLMNIFRVSIFFSGLAINLLVALLLSYVGEILGLSLYMVAILFSGTRIFNNLAIIRRLLIS